MLESISYHDLTLEQITRDAGIPTSVFYHYFSSKEELARELADEIFAEYDHLMKSARPFGTFERGIRFANLELLRLYSRYVGVMRCLTEVEAPHFAERWREHTYKWRRGMGKNFLEFCDSSSPDEDELIATAHTLSMLSDAFAYEYCVLANPDLRRKFTTLEFAADFLSSMWLRALFLKHPTAENETVFSTLNSLADRDTTEGQDPARGKVAD